jgi:thiol:disulfide interchange protein
MPVDIRNSAHLREILAEQGKLVVVDYTATWW